MKSSASACVLSICDKPLTVEGKVTHPIRGAIARNYIEAKPGGVATLDAATFTDTAGTLDVTSTAKINLGTDDADGDGFTNLHEFPFGTSPTAGNGALVTTTASGCKLFFRVQGVEN